MGYVVCSCPYSFLVTAERGSGSWTAEEQQVCRARILRKLRENSSGIRGLAVEGAQLRQSTIRTGASITPLPTRSCGQGSVPLRGSVGPINIYAFQPNY